MTLEEIQVGDAMYWLSGRDAFPVLVQKIGKKRVTVVTEGGHVASVNPGNLEWPAQDPQTSAIRVLP